MAAYRRYIKKPETIETKAQDTIALLLIAFIIITGFLVEGLRIATAGDSWAFLSFVGLATSKIFSGISEETTTFLHKFFWWFHTALAMGWIATIPYTKFFHILTLPANIFFSKLNPRGELKRIDIEALMSADDFNEENFKIGVEKATDFTWKQRLDFDACISCGRCEEVCPAFVEHVDDMIELRRNEVIMKGRMPSEAARTLKRLESIGNPFAPQSDRVNWIEQLNVRIVNPAEEVDVLYWIGCCTTFDPTKQKLQQIYQRFSRNVRLILVFWEKMRNTVETRQDLWDRSSSFRIWQNSRLNS